MAIIFNGVTRQIEVTDPSIFSLDAGKEIYSEWKRWQQLDTANGGYAPAFRTFGGDATAPGQNAPKYYFLQNFWTVLIDNGNVVNVAINLYSDNFITPYIVAPGSGVSDRNSDAVSVNSEAIEYASFNGGVTVDIDNISGIATAGTSFPKGTPQAPSDNLLDASIIASNRGLGKAYIVGNLTLSDEASWDRFSFIGESAGKTLVTLNAEAEVSKTEYYDMTIQGVFDGDSLLSSVVINNIEYINGICDDVLINGTIKLGPFTVAHFLDSSSGVPGTSTPVIDFNFNNSALAMRGYSGGIALRNKDKPDSVSIDLLSGQVILENTVTAGTIVVRGVGKLIDTNGDRIPSGLWNGSVVILNETVGSEGTSGGSIWTEQEKDDLIADTAIIKDQSEISAVHAVEELN